VPNDHRHLRLVTKCLAIAALDDDHITHVWELDWDDGIPRAAQ
jgi:hypothetical protein